jgi:hypothetical protein
MLYDCIPSKELDTIASNQVQGLQLSVDNCIVSLECELFTLRDRQVFDGVEIQKRSDKGKAKETVPVTAPSTIAKPTEATQESCDLLASAPDITAPPLHLFANIPEAQYTPLSTRNFAAPVDREKATKDKEPAYRMIAPIQNS